MSNCQPLQFIIIIDYLTVNDPTLQTPLNDSQKADLYAELATAAEAGWDFSSRWFAGSTSTLGGLLSLNGRSMVGPDLNGIICELYISASPKMMQGLIYILQTRIIYRWQNFTALPIQLQLTYTRPLLHPLKLVFWIFFGIQKKFVVILSFFRIQYNLFRSLLACVLRFHSQYQQSQ